MTIAHVDFETKSIYDLPAGGSWNYARHPSTFPWCMAYAFDDGPVQLWTPNGDQFPAELEDHVVSGLPVWGHNVAGFEFHIWNEILVPKLHVPRLELEQLTDTMAMAYAMGLPGSLERAAAAVGLDILKDMDGHRVMLQLAQPRKFAECDRCHRGRVLLPKSGDPDDDLVLHYATCPECHGSFQKPVWWTPESAPEKHEKLHKYCINDVEVERALGKRLLALSSSEREMWELDHRINCRGVQLDIPSIKAALTVVEIEKSRLDLRMSEVTAGAVRMCTAAGQLADWIGTQGVGAIGVAKSEVVRLLKDETLPALVREALQLRQEAAKSSTAKLVAMLERASPDGRARGLYQYHGAATGRWAGRAVQPQNMPRSSLSPQHVDDIFADCSAETIRMFHGPPMQVLAECLRGLFVAKPGHELVGADLASIEARVLAWLAGEERVLEIFRTHGKIYEHAAAGIYGVPLDSIAKTDPRRQVGKVAVLALGYGGGVGAFQTMSKGYGVKVSDEQADTIKTAWRAAHPNIVRYWKELEAAAIAAVQQPGTGHSAGKRPVTYKVAGSFLWCRLPSGRALCYPYPKVEPVMAPWGELKEGLTYMTVDSLTRQWVRTKTYGGFWSENVTQAVSADFLRESIKRAEARGWPVVLHTHDSMNCEVPIGSVKVAEMEALMSVVPVWAAGLPIAAEGSAGRRYGK